MKISNIILAAVGFLLAAILLPIAMGQIVGTTTTGWNSAVVTIFQVVVPVLAIIGIALYFIPRLGNGE